jgi:transcriptional regulator with XRE-family HTH domain
MAQLRMARAALGWSLKELAEKAKVHLNTVSRCEAGYEALTGTMQRIEDVFSAQQGAKLDPSSA